MKPNKSNRRNCEASKEKSVVTLEDVNKAIRNNFQVKNMFITIVTDKSEAEALAESLRSNAASPMSYSNSLKAVLTPKIMSEDEEVATFPLTVTDVTIVNSKDLFIK